jgi:hypothetical protein
MLAKAKKKEKGTCETNYDLNLLSEIDNMVQNVSVIFFFK